MSDTTGFLAGCATTGMVVLLLLVARVGFDDSLPMVQARPDIVSSNELPPVPVPSPPSTVQEQQFGNFEPLSRRDLDRQQDLIARLESQLDDQKILIRDLENELEQQQTETAEIVLQLQEYRHSMDTLSAQQVRAVELSRQQLEGEGQKVLLWVGAGVVLVLIFGGGLVLVILIIMAAQSRRRSSRNSQITHPINVTPTYHYYEHEFLPPPQVPPRQAGQYEPFDYG